MKDYSKTVFNLTKKYTDLWSTAFSGKCEVTYLGSTRKKIDELENNLEVYEAQIKQIYFEGLSDCKKAMVEHFQEKEKKFWKHFVEDKLETYKTENSPDKDFRRYLSALQKLCDVDDFGNPRPDTRLLREYIKTVKKRVSDINSVLERIFFKNNVLPNDEKKNVENDIKDYERKIEEYKESKTKMIEDIREKRNTVKML